jgi:hypothetical protein
MFDIFKKRAHHRKPRTVRLYLECLEAREVPTISTVSLQYVDGNQISGVFSYTNGMASKYTGSINWGNGQTTQATIGPAGSGLLQLTGGSGTTIGTGTVAPEITLAGAGDSLTTDIAELLPSPGNQSNAIGDSVSVFLSGTEEFGNSLAYSATGLPPGLSVNSTNGAIYGNIGTTASVSSPYTVAVTSTDGVVTVVDHFSWSITAISLQNPGNQANIPGATVSLRVTAADGYGYSLTYYASGLPAGLTINSQTGVISGVISSSASSSTVTIGVTNGSNYSSQTFTWNIAPLVITNPGAQLQHEGDSVSLAIQVQALSQSLTYSAGGLPAGLSINSSTGVISGTIQAGTIGDFYSTVTVFDGQNNTASQTFEWVVDPVIAVSVPANQSALVGTQISLQATATDANNSAVTYSAQGLPSGLSINCSTGAISGTISACAPGGEDDLVTVTATDGTYTQNNVFTFVVAQQISVPVTLPQNIYNQIVARIGQRVVTAVADEALLTAIRLAVTPTIGGTSPPTVAVIGGFDWPGPPRGSPATLADALGISLATQNTAITNAQNLVRNNGFPGAVATLGARVTYGLDTTTGGMTTGGVSWTVSFYLDITAPGLRPTRVPLASRNGGYMTPRYDANGLSASC